MMSCRSYLPLVLAAAAVPLLGQAARAQQGRSIEILEPTEQVCRSARTARERQQEALCVIGLARDPGGVAKVTVNGVVARTSADSASGGVRFVTFVPPVNGGATIEVTLEPKQGAPFVQRYALGGAAGAGTSYTITNLTPRVLGGAPAPAAVVAQAPPPAPASADPAAPASPGTGTAAAPAPTTPSPAVQTASAEPSAPAVSAPAGTTGSVTAPQTSPASLAAAPGVAAPGGQVAQQPVPGTPLDPAAAATAALAAAAPAATAVAVEDSRNYVQILEPKEWSSVATRSITVAPRSSIRVVGLAQHSAGVARIDVNGVRAAFTPDAGGAERFVAYVPADAARRDVEVVVRGSSGPPVVKHYEMEMGPAPAAVAAAPGAPPAADRMPGAFRGRRWAVVVGISQFADHNITGLRYADADARAFYEFLRSPRAGGGGFAEENVKLLLNEQATYREIRAALFTFLKGATEDDQVIVYFAGHGAPDPQRIQNLYLLTYDTDLADISSSAFPMDDVNKAIHSLYAHDVVVITDACHSAGVGGQVATRDLGGNGINEIFLQQLSASTGGLAIFTASGANQLSQEDARWGGGHGVFTHYLLDALNGAADEDGDRIVTLSEMMEYARGKVRVDTRNAQIPTISQTAYDPFLPMSIVDASVASAAQPAAPVAASLPVAGAAREPVPAARPTPATPQQVEAIGRFQEAVRLYPRSAVYRRNLGVALREAGRTQEAVTELQEAARLEPANPEYVYELGVTLRAAGMMAEAVGQFEAATRADNRNALYFNALGNALLAQERTDEALDRLRRAVGLNRENGAYHRDLAAAMLKAGRADDAVNELKQAVALDARSAAFHVELAQALDATGRTEEALPEYQQATIIEPANPALKASFARALRAAGRGPEAAQQLKSAVALEARNAAYRHDLGVLLRDQGMPYEMLVEFREAVRLSPAVAEYRYDLGMALAGSNQGPAAATELKEAVRLAPANAQYQNSLGTVLKASGSPQDAMAALREAVKAAPDNARYHYDLAVLLRDLGMVEEAIQELDAATRLDPRNRDYRTELSTLRNRSRGS
jgi:tetratricopeptide (TPR) repeat protein